MQVTRAPSAFKNPPQRLRKSHPEPPARPEPVDRVELASFPESWVGNWKGELHIVGVAGSQTVPMALDIQPKGPDRYTWEIRYGNQPARPYELVPVRPEAGHWVIDENNGILIDSFHLGDEFVSQFEINQVRISTRHKLDGEVLKVELDSFTRAPLRRSGSQPNLVDAFAGQTIQRAELRRET